MKKKSYGGLTVILFICIIAFGCGSLAGMNHIGQEYTDNIIPTSLIVPVDKISTIDENFEANNITIKLYIPKTVSKNVTVVNNTNTTNTTNSSNYSNRSYSNSSRNYSY